ncbi:MAG TPA: sulfatase-like hydrolase/transferase [Solirubrobacteraceae bacterium]|nr:sulfatase-like hydrolase/transferase [Solirubrobacteraceae bacterium]
MIFALFITFVPPAVLVLLVWLAGRIRPALGDGLHLVFVGLLAAAIVLPPIGDLLGGSAVAVPVAALVGAGLAALYARAAAVRTFITVLSPVPLLFLVLFLVVSPVSELVLPEDAEAVAGQSRSRTPVVVVVFDELPATSLMDPRDRIDADRYPAFASFARKATWYRNATTVAGRTTEAVPALLTGRRPREGDLPIAADHPQSLFTLLSRSHRLSVIEPITDVCPSDLCAEDRPGLGNRLRDLALDLRVVSAHLLLPDDLDDELPPIDRDWQGFENEAIGPRANREQRRRFIEEVFERLGNDDPPARFEQTIEAIREPGTRPPLIFLHTSIPHIPWRYLPDGTPYETGMSLPGVVDGIWVGPQWLANQGFQRHLLQTQYADRLLGNLFDALEEEGIYDRALIVVAADHGVSFRAGDRRRRPTPSNVHDVANVPLLIKNPGQEEGRVVDTAVRTIDVLPTIARELGLRLSDPVDGVPADERDADPEQEIDVPDSWEAGTTTIFGTFLRQRAERRRYERSLLEPAGYDVMDMGPRPELVGRRVGVVPAGDGRARLDDPGAYEDVDPDLPPVWVAGTTTVPGASELAIVINGRIAATTQVDRRRFAALVPPGVLRAGANEVEILEIDGDTFRKL